MDRRVAKDLLHIEHWLDIASGIVAKGHEAYLNDEVSQEAGDSLMIKIGEACKNLSSKGLPAPEGFSWSDAAKNREVLAHHYSIIDREVTWNTLSTSLPAMQRALAELFAEAHATLATLR